MNAKNSEPSGEKKYYNKIIQCMEEGVGNILVARRVTGFIY